MIKIKMEALADIIKIPICGFFSIRENRFMKPHTGMWKFLNLYAEGKIKSAVVISNEGGLVTRKEKRNGDEIVTVRYTDADRAFAHNIDVPFYSIEEYLDSEVKTEFKWDSYILEPSVREYYIKEINSHTNPNVFKELGNFGKQEAYCIIILGAPRSGKTRFAKYLLKTWRESSFGKNNAIERMGLDRYTKIGRYKHFCRTILNRISVILDGGCHTETDRMSYVRFAKEHSIPILYIDIECGKMAEVFNHVCVEEAQDEKTTLYKRRVYYEYRSLYKKPRVNNTTTRYLSIYPHVELKPSIVKFRY